MSPCRRAGTPRDPRNIPSVRVASTEHIITAAPMSTSLLEFINFGYGNPTIRLASVTVMISSAVFASWIHACGLRVRDLAESGVEPAEMALVLSTERPAVAEGGFEHWVDLDRHHEPASTSAGRFISSFSPMIRGMSSSAAFAQSSVAPARERGMKVLNASPPARIAMSSDPSRISVAVTLSNDCGLLPPPACRLCQFDAGLVLAAEPESLCEEPGCVPVSPADHVDDAGSSRRRAARPDRHRRRRHGRRGSISATGSRASSRSFGPVVVLADADDHGRTGRQRHGETLGIGVVEVRSEALEK